MTTIEKELPTIFLKSGEIHFTDRPGCVVTVLGSCVSVTLFHRRLGIGAICHGLLPHCRNRNTCGPGCVESARYVECSLRTMIDRFKKSGILPRELETRIYGGADMFGVSAGVRSRFSVGKQNIETALNVLQREGVQVHALDVGGNQGRKIYFNTQTGEVQSNLLQPSVLLAGRNGNGKKHA